VRGTGPSIKREIDINGRWTERLGASVAENGSWVRFYLTDPTAPLETVTKWDVDGDGELEFVTERPGAAPRRYPYRYVAYIEVREAGWFMSTPELATEQTWRGHQVRWRPCQ